MGAFCAPSRFTVSRDNDVQVEPDQEVFQFVFIFGSLELT